MKKLAILFFILFSFTQCYHAHPVKVMPGTAEVPKRTLFIALDGVDYTLMHELKQEGYFQDFQDPVPLVSTFPSATTVGFTGLYQPLEVGKVPGYEVRFYSFEENRIMGGTPLDIYKIPINYKYYFDNFRFTMQQKAVMYTFPSMASKEDLVNTKKVVMTSEKQVMMTYLGGTDGSAHMLGRPRTKRTLIFMDKFLKSMQKKYFEKYGESLKIILFSDHGFEYNRLKTVSNGEIKKRLEQNGFEESTHLKSDKDVVFVKFGLLSAGVAYLRKSDDAPRLARLLSGIDGIDLSFWTSADKKKVFIKNHQGDEAYFEYRSTSVYRYVAVTGDPLGYNELLKKTGHSNREWISDATWKEISFNHNYPDAGYRLYDSFFRLVQNQASVMFSTLPDYQFGATVTRIGTWSRLGQHGTHGGLFRQTTWAFAMTNMDNNPHPPKHFRYDDFFRYYLPSVTLAYQQEIQNKIKTTPTSPDLHAEFHADEDPEMNMQSFKQQLAALENYVLDNEPQ